MEQQMTMNKKKSYVEILEILKYMDEVYVDKIPKKLIEFFEENKEKNYSFKYNNAVELEKQNLNDNTLALLAMLNLNYWCESEEHKKELIAKYNDNEQKHQEELRKKYNLDNIFKRGNQEKSIEENIVKEEVAMVAYKDSILKKFIKKIKSFLYKMNNKMPYK